MMDWNLVTRKPLAECLQKVNETFRDMKTHDIVEIQTDQVACQFTADVGRVTVTYVFSEGVRIPQILSDVGDGGLFPLHYDWPSQRDFCIAQLKTIMDIDIDDIVGYIFWEND